MLVHLAVDPPPHQLQPGQKHTCPCLVCDDSIMSCVIGSRDSESDSMEVEVEGLSVATFGVRLHPSIRT
jgi:hypothetical protein